MITHKVKITHNLGDLDKEINEKLPRKIAYAIRDSARFLFRTSKASGRLYPRRRGLGFKRFHRASAPGEIPAIDSGRLSKDIDVNKKSKSKYEVVFNAEYSAIVNETRPFALKSIDRAIEETTK